MTLCIFNSRMLNKEDSNERHEESDSNSDGFVTWDEYVEENYGISGLDDNPELELDENMVEEKRVCNNLMLYRCS